MSRRCSDASIAARMCLRDRPRPLGPGVIWPWTFVAMTASSRERYFGHQAAGRHLAGAPEYTSAVSKNVIPASTARRMIGSALASSSTHGRSESLP